MDYELHEDEYMEQLSGCSWDGFEIFSDYCVDMSSNLSRKEIEHNRAMEERQWRMMSYEDRKQAEQDMEITGNYWGPNHIGHEHWL